jgi:crotonobetainyl-CoA:carnitine CoA-transferase CaiB-like acyl-CoA transferase
VLDGIRVVELGVWVAGPGAGGVLADWGADVVKVEPPGGDPMRRMLAVAGGGREDLPSPPFDLDNRGKRSIVLDLAGSEGDREVMDRLLGTADVFLTNLRPDAVERLGLGPEALLDRFPRLVYASLTGYGRSGPDAGRAGYDVGAFWARSGLAAMAVPPDAPQPHFRGGVGDHVTAITTVAGVLAALLERERTGRGRLVETSLLRTGIWALGWDLGLQLRFGRLLAPQPRTEQANPLLNVYRAGDGRWFWLLGLEGDRHWPRLLAAVDRPEWETDERFSSMRARRLHAAELVAALDELFAAAPRDEWTARFDAHDVWWAPVNTPAEVVDDPQALAAGAFVDVPGGAGTPPLRAVATPVSFPARPGSGDPDGDAARPRGPVPALGEHTAELRSELGL